MMRFMPGPDYFYRTGYQNPFHQFEETKPKSDSIFSLINDKENLNRINKIANEGVNHIVAAFYIQSVQQSRNAKNNENSGTNIIRRASVPVNSVSLEGTEQPQLQQTQINPIKENEAILNQGTVSLLNNNTAMTNPNISTDLKSETTAKNSFTGNIPDKPDIQLTNNNSQRKSSFTNIFNDNFTPDLNEITANQLSSVNDMVKKLKENKIGEIIDKNMNSKE